MQLKTPKSVSIYELIDDRVIKITLFEYLRKKVQN